ncbi:hypothetical protein KAZ66_00800 [Candidatus Woesebacteria bacterium]|nr:hypothetical protein [Candidatus Woesebacteria bacterium]
MSRQATATILFAVMMLLVGCNQASKPQFSQEEYRFLSSVQDNDNDTCSSTQTHHENQQLKKRDEIKEGGTYFHVYSNHTLQTIHITKAPYQNDEWDWVIDYYLEERPQYIETLYLADIGIVPYSPNCWNKWNYLKYAPNL